ncbi:MAG: response regulator, partial [Proteobacteria bacterium]|nr:response regulator [Pseudomonadota bacterium]
MADKSEESFAAELQSIFLTETHEMLDDTEAAFMQIEENPDDDAKIDKIFRLVHTIKGSAHVAGFTQLGNFSHSFETLLAAIREKKLKVEPSIVDILLAGNDCIRLFVDTLRQDPSSQLDVAAIESKIRSAYTVTGAEKPNPPPQPAKVESHSKVPASNIQPLPLGNADNSSSLVRADKRNILICDDDEDILEILADLVESGGHRVVRVMNGLEALKAMRSESFDVIVSDLKMPEMDGEEFVREVRKFNHLIPIIIISGFSSRDNLKTFVQLGVDEFIDKPFNDEMVL